ncbi:hypothetical protein [Rivularia sp. UHCC 0363]|nr:hypothetical protein [Rivularia sp. UHCC 0363]MEA5595743.1 hypothetical protein [Rivularia sp. UHCC 0363]
MSSAYAIADAMKRGRAIAIALLSLDIYVLIDRHLFVFKGIYNTFI